MPVNALVNGPGFDADALRGFPAVKVKVGSPGDVELVAEVRDAIGPQVALRVDANGAWDVDTAIDTIKRLARYDLEFVEQPVASLDDLARVRRRSTYQWPPTNVSARLPTRAGCAHSTPPMRSC